MLDRRLRPHSESFLSRLATGPLLAIAPLAFSSVGFLIGIFAAGAAAAQLWGLALVGWLINRFLDGLDGAVARSAGRESDRGGYLDMAADVVVYAAIPIGAAFGVDSKEVWIATTILVAGFYLNTVSWLYLSAIREKRGRGAASRGESTAISMPGGLIEGTETIVWFVVILALPSLMVWTVGSMAFAVVLSAVIRFRRGASLLDEEQLEAAPGGRQRSNTSSLPSEETR